MRFSVEPGDRGYDPKHKTRVAAVHVDGHPVIGCLAADDAEGWVKELVPDPEKPGYFRHDGIDFITRERRGHVVITLKDRSRDWDRDRRANGARVQVGRDPATMDILVQVFSVVRPGAIKQMRMAFKDLPSGLDAVAQKAGMSAGAGAEMLGEQFGDTVDPSVAARTAIEQCTEMLLAEQSGGGRKIAEQSIG